MDAEVVAAVVAGVAGTVGAVAGAAVGGKFAERGAKVGAAKAVEAAQLQVDGQAETEYRQWVRNQRQQSYARFLDAYAALNGSLTGAMPAIRAGGRFSDEVRSEIDARAAALRSCTSQLALWGPEEAYRLAGQVTLRALDAAQALRASQGAVAATQAGSSTAWQEWEQASRGMVAAHSTFLARVGEIIRDPRQSAT